MRRDTSRFEYKYRLDISQYYALKNALRPYVNPDYYTKISPNNRYLVRSLYYDSNDLQAFYERNDGQYGRIKLRIRTYTTNPNQDSKISVEMKTKKGGSMLKYSTLVPISYYYHFLDNKNWPQSEPVLDEFHRLMRVRQLFPQLIVQYDREGYIPKQKCNLRITFDHNVCSSRASYLFSNDLLLKEHRPKNIILEIKCRGEQPPWLVRLIKKHNLKVITNSKYVQGIEIIRPIMVTPKVEVGSGFND